MCCVCWHGRGEGVHAVYQENVVPAVLTERRRDVAEAVGVAQRQQWPAIVLRRNNVDGDGDCSSDGYSDRNSNDDAAMFAVAVVSVCPQSLPKRRGVNGGSPFGADRLPKHKNNFVTRFHYHCVCVYLLFCALHSSLSARHSVLFTLQCESQLVAINMEEDSKEETGLRCRSPPTYCACCCWVPVAAGVANSPTGEVGEGSKC